MKLTALVGALSMLALSVGCSTSDSEKDTSESGKEQPGSSDQECRYDTPETLLAAMKKAFGDQATAHVEMEMTGGGVDMAMTADMEMTNEGASMDATFTGQDEFAVIVVDDEYYVSETATNPTYTKLEGADAAMMKEQMGSSDLRSTFKAFDAGLEAVESEGRETVDGEDACAYALTVDTAKATEASGQDPQPGMPETLTYDVLLNDDDLMRRVSFELGPITMVMDMTEWNEPVDIKAPIVG